MALFFHKRFEEPIHRLVYLWMGVALHGVNSIAPGNRRLEDYLVLLHADENAEAVRQP